MRVRATACLAMCLLFAFSPAAAQVSGVVFNDRNGNGQREAGEPGVARVVVSNQVDAVATDSSGTFRLGGPGTGIIFVSVPDGSRATKRFWLYGRGMYRHFLGPDYYSFNAGGMHFVGLNTADNDDLWYYGHVDSTQLRWLARDLAHVPPAVPIVTFNHIPLASGMPSLAGVEHEPPAPTILRVQGRDVLRHVVANLSEVLAVVGNRPFPLALGGHNHARERLEFGLQGRSPVRFEQTGAVVGPAGMPWFPMASGITIYTIRGGRISDGTFVRLDPVPMSR